MDVIVFPKLMIPLMFQDMFKMCSSLNFFVLKINQNLRCLENKDMKMKTLQILKTGK